MIALLLLMQGAAYDVAVEPLRQTFVMPLMDPKSDAPLPFRFIAINRRAQEKIEVPVPEDFAAHVIVQRDDGTVIRKPAESPAIAETRRLAFGEFFGREVDVAEMLRGADEGIYYVSWKLGEAASRPIPVMVIRPYRAVFETNLGEFSIVLAPQAAPKTVLNFVRLVRENFYSEKGRTFHRILPGLLIQGGCPEGDGTGHSDFIEDEFHPLARHMPGTVSMANAGKPNSASCQFFVCLDAFPGYDGRYAAFGQIADAGSMKTIQAIAETETTHHKCPVCDDKPCQLQAPACEEHHNHSPLSPVTIKNATLEVIE